MHVKIENAIISKYLSHFFFVHSTIFPHPQNRKFSINSTPNIFTNLQKSQKKIYIYKFTQNINNFLFMHAHNPTIFFNI